MARPMDGLDARVVPGGMTAANDDAIENAGPEAGWDPFEVWRTRVKDVREQIAREGDEDTTG